MKYTVVSNGFILDNEIGNGAKMAYLTLCTLAEELHYIQVSEKVLAGKLDVSDRTVRNNISELEKYGLIAKYRTGFKEVTSYVVIPYEIRKQVELETEEQVDSLVTEVREYVNKVKENVEDTTEIPTEEEGKEFHTYDYCKYFADKVLEKRGQMINTSNHRILSIMKRVTKDKPQEYNLKLIDIFIEIYDIKFNRKGYETPTVEGFGTSWIYNILVDLEKRVTRRNDDNEEMADEVF